MVTNTNKLILDEAIAVVLINKTARREHLTEIQKILDERKLYTSENSDISLHSELYSFYESLKINDSVLFNDIGDGFIELKDCYANSAMQLWEDLKQILEPHRDFFEPPAIKLPLIHTTHGWKDDIEVRPDKIVCILATNINMEKAVFLFDQKLTNSPTIIKFLIKGDIYTFSYLCKLIDPTANYLTIIGKKSVVNVQYFNLSANNTLKPLIEFPKNIKPRMIELSDGDSAINYKENFIKIKKYQDSRILLRKTVYEFGLQHGFNLEI